MTVNAYKSEIQKSAAHAELKKLGIKMYGDEKLKANEEGHRTVMLEYQKQRAKLDKEFARTSVSREFKTQLYYINTMSNSEKNLKVRVARVGKTLHALVGKGVFSSVEGEILFRAYKYQKRKMMREGRLEANLPLGE